jgi:hypothetical protein
MRPGDNVVILRGGNGIRGPGACLWGIQSHVPWMRLNAEASGAGDHVKSGLGPIPQRIKHKHQGTREAVCGSVWEMIGFT